MSNYLSWATVPQRTWNGLGDWEIFNTTSPAFGPENLASSTVVAGGDAPWTTVMGTYEVRGLRAAAAPVRLRARAGCACACAPERAAPAPAAPAPGAAVQRSGRQARLAARPPGAAAAAKHPPAAPTAPRPPLSCAQGPNGTVSSTQYPPNDLVAGYSGHWVRLDLLAPAAASSFSIGNSRSYVDDMALTGPWHFYLFGGSSINNPRCGWRRGTRRSGAPLLHRLCAWRQAGPPASSSAGPGATSNPSSRSWTLLGEFWVPTPWQNGTEASHTFYFPPATVASFAIVVNQIFPQTEPKLQRVSLGSMAAFAPPPPPPSPPPPRCVADAALGGAVSRGECPAGGALR